ncbi:MAG TPA: tetratricopeptide repeat protein [Kofleriaceae bacterium]|nr:tetratricopeptide repeat protein [Kofleriaceae bacterium]
MTLDDHVAALRELGGDDPEIAAETRARVVRSLERGSGVRRQLASALTLLGVLLAATASWALATGQLQRVWSHAHAVAPHAEPPAATPPPRAAPVHPPAIVRAPPAPPVAPPRHAPPRRVAIAPAPPPATFEPLYRKAHELYFHGDDYPAALAAWDAYLAAEPTGPFAIEARYNRALCLVRLGRLAEARDALAPFARGAVDPAGYRQAEARALVERIAARLGD